ncbi:uncharacterized protein LOC131009899 [Salvia miltiorrhiza]|uniref:uncharacterized protein LOC131009899 n=1 Tax=Salvia miltiorrhiza TaxID=226208 RepID=UPI0025ACDCED|nr:uncharacterized protein LOC131009899 [Salvia miltiorrhiza]
MVRESKALGSAGHEAALTGAVDGARSAGMWRVAERCGVLAVGGWAGAGRGWAGVAALCGGRGWAVLAAGSAGLGARRAGLSSAEFGSAGLDSAELINADFGKARRDELSCVGLGSAAFGGAGLGKAGLCSAALVKG